MKIIAFVGMPAAGKSEASAIARDMNIPVVNMGDAVREETARRGLPPTDENMGSTGTDLRREEGMDAIAKRCMPWINELNSPVIVVDGIRNMDEVNYFKEQFGSDFRLVAIHTPLEVRFRRAKNRARSDDMDSIHELYIRDEREKSWGLEKAIEMADITLVNTNSLDTFHKKIKQLLGNL